MPETNNSAAPLVIGLDRRSPLILELIDEHHGAAVGAQSALIEGRRTIAVQLGKGAPLGGSIIGER